MPEYHCYARSVTMSEGESKTWVELGQGKDKI